MKMLSITMEKIRNIVNQRPVLFVVVLSGLAGLCLGLSNATWQVSVETGQVIANIVKYPPDNPFYMYHIKAFTIINYISAFLLYLFGSERMVSIVISGFLGVVSFQAIGLLIFSINRNVWLSVLGPIFIYFANYVGKSVVYPIWLLGFQHTYGILGLSFIVLTIALISANCYRTGLFFLGLAPCVHFSWGLWLLFVIGLTALWNRAFMERFVKKKYWYFAAGLFITVSLFLYHSYSIRMLPAVESVIEKPYLDSYIRYWDSHRIKLYWDTFDKNFFSHRWGIFLCVYSIIAAFIGLKYFKKKDSASFLFMVTIVAGFSSLLAGIITQLPPQKVPMYLLMLMPGRYINLNNLVLAACLIGLLTFDENKKYVVNYNLFVLILLCSFFSRHAEVQMVCFGAVIFWLAYVLVKKFSGDSKKPLLQRSHKVGYEMLLLMFIGIFLFVNVFNKKFVNRYLVRQEAMKDRTNDEFYSVIAQGKGLLLTTIHSSMISLRTRRPILADMASPNFFIYAPGSALIFNNILKKIYGVDLLIPPPEHDRHREIRPELYKVLWEKRTVERWQEMRDEFGVTDILTKTDWTLSLPVAAKSSDAILYQIPVVRE